VDPRVITTERLRLVPHEPALLRALIQGPECYARVSGMTPANGLREFIVSPDVSAEWLAALQTAASADPWKYGFAVVEIASGLVIGNGGFAGAPDANGVVEIAYGIVPDYEGHGYATEVAAALVAYAQNEGRARTVCAHTLPARNASTRILEKCSFRFAGEVNHPTDGLIWRWERELTSA
jgi:[ribosomal protein S5]-alanine N-acetyltransferase